MRAICILLLFSCIASADEVDVALALAKAKAGVQPVKTWPTWAEMGGGPAVVFVGVPAREVAGMRVGWEKEFPGLDRGVVVTPDGVMRVDLPESASDAQIVEAGRKPDPFRLVQSSRGCST